MNPNGPPVAVGSNVKVTLSPFSIAITDASGKEILKTLGGDSADAYAGPASTLDVGPDNVKALPGWDGYIPDEKPWVHATNAKQTASTVTGATFDIGAEFTIAIDTADEKITVDVTAKNPDHNKSTLAFALPADEHFFGLGERFATLDHRGFSLYSWAEEGGVGRGEGVGPNVDNPAPNGPSMTYFPVPFFLSSNGYAVHLDTTYRTETHFGSEKPDAWRIAANTKTWRAVIYVNDDPKKSLDHYTKDTGRPMVPATWVFGPSRRVSFDNQVDGVDEYKVLRSRKVPTTFLDDAVHFLPANSQVGRDDRLKQWTKDAHAAGYKVVAYNNPYVAFAKDSIATERQYGIDHDLFVKQADGQVAQTSFISGELLNLATIDLTKPEGVAFFQSLLKRTLDYGYDGWMHDFGEYVRRPWRFADGRNGEAVHNEFPVLSAKAAHDLMERERPGDYLFYVRSGYAGTQQYAPAVWGGDAEADFDETQGIPSTVRSGLNLGMSGISVWGSDLTGYKCINDAPHDKEMYLRWAEIGAVSPFMLEENACANPLGNREKWKLWADQETVDVYGAMSRLHTRLAPYLEVAVRQSNASGIPIMRHPFLTNPKEPEVYKMDSSYWFGDALFTSPVVKRGDITKDTWLPPGRFVDFDDHTVYEGGKHVSIPAPLGKLPLLVKDGGIVPLLDASVETLGTTPDPTVATMESTKDRLDVVVVLSKGGEAHVTLADGTELTAKRLATGGASSGLAEGDTQTCLTGCITASAENQVDRLRVSTAPVTTNETMQDDLVLSVKGTTTRRVRWDVIRLR